MVIVGWREGYRDPSAYVAFWSAAGLVAGSAVATNARIFPSDRGVGLLIRVAVAAVAAIVACTMILGAARRLTLTPMLLTETAVFVATAGIARRRHLPRGRPSFAALPAAVIVIGGSMLALALAFGATHAPLTLYDSLSYHLFFAGRWVQDHAITIIPTPFSDEAQAYAPANGEAFFAWLMLPFHGDLIARIGQFPFALLGAATLYALARRAGASSAQAAYPPAFFLLSRPVAEQMVGANVDLICAALFAVSLYLGIAAVDRDEPHDWVLFGVAAGLYCGTKYLALVYTPVLVLLVCARGLRRRMLWSLPGIAAFGLPWYARNWIVAGSPIYPASLTVGGVTIARGAFTRAAMLNTIFHTTNVRLLPAMLAHGIGPSLFIIWLPCAIAGWIVMARRGWWPAGVLAMVPIVMLPLYWFGFPVNVDSRFLMPAIGPALLPFAFLIPRHGRAVLTVHAAYAAALLWLLVGVRAQLPGSLPWFMDGWLTLNGLVSGPFLIDAAATGAALGLIWAATRRTQWTGAALAGGVAVAAIVLTLGADSWCGAGGCAYLDTTPTFIRTGYADSWRWMAGNVTHATVAYTGINLPYPLSGRQLTNRVVYANIDGRTHWRFHDYDHAFRTGRFDPEPPLLARSSGELMPVANRQGPRDDAVRPRYERMHGIRDAWVFNLETLDVRYVYVATLSAYELDYVWHNDRRFPIEDDWAQEDPTRFHLVYANTDVHVYAFDTGVKART